MRRTVAWTWQRRGTVTVLMIRTWGLEFKAERQALHPYWQLRVIKPTPTAPWTMTPKMMVRKIRAMVGEVLAKKFAGVDR